MRPTAFLLAGAFAAAALSAQQQPPVHGGVPSVSPDGARIAFLADRDGATDVYVISVDGTGETRLTHTPEAEGRPEWSPDGKHIRFTVFSNEANTSAIYSIDPEGRNRTQIGAVPGRALGLSPDGKKILYWTGTWTAMKMFVSDLDGSNAKALTDGSGVVWGARWSRDGKRIAFADKAPENALHVYAIASDGSDRRQITRFDASDGRAQMPAWAPDGKSIAVQASGKDTAHLWVVDVATGTARKLAPHEQAYLDEVPAWFPDGTRLAFQSNRTGRMEVWVVNADGSNARQVTR